MKKYVYCTLQVEGVHSWSNCDIDEVNYLCNTHRHVFHIKAVKEVNHEDRDIEFIKLKHEILQYLNLKYDVKPLNLCDFGNQSCEMIAAELIHTFCLYSCEVSEDRENGSILIVENKDTDIDLRCDGGNCGSGSCGSGSCGSGSCGSGSCGNNCHCHSEESEPTETECVTEEVDIPQDHQLLLVESYIETNMSKCSQEAFRLRLEETGDHSEALWLAVINEMTGKILEDVIVQNKLSETNEPDDTILVSQGC